MSTVSFGGEDDVGYISAAIESAAQEGSWIQGANEDEGGTPGLEAATGERSKEADGVGREVMGIREVVGAPARGGRIPGGSERGGAESRGVCGGVRSIARVRERNQAGDLGVPEGWDRRIAELYEAGDPGVPEKVSVPAGAVGHRDCGAEVFWKKGVSDCVR